MTPSFSRTRAPQPATIPIGLFGVAAGTEGLYAVRTGGASGDDFTSLFSLPAGLLLLGLAVSILWRSRRMDDTRLRRYTRRVSMTVGGLALTAGIGVPMLFGYGYTHLARNEVPKVDLGTAYEDVGGRCGLLEHGPTA